MPPYRRPLPLPRFKPESPDKDKIVWSKCPFCESNLWECPKCDSPISNPPGRKVCTQCGYRRV